MDCARCGGQLDTYSLNGNEACVCLDCGFVDTPVDHENVDWNEPESWSTAIQRFYEKHTEAIED